MSIAMIVLLVIVIIEIALFGAAVYARVEDAMEEMKNYVSQEHTEMLDLIFNMDRVKEEAREM